MELSGTWLSSAAGQGHWLTLHHGLDSRDLGGAGRVWGPGLRLGVSQFSY